MCHKTSEGTRIPTDSLGTLSYSNVTNGGSFIETNRWSPGVCAAHTTWHKPSMLDETGLNLCPEADPNEGLLGFFAKTKFKPEPTQNITVGSKKAQAGQSAMRSDDYRLHRSIPLRKKTKMKRGWVDSWVIKVSPHMQIRYRCHSYPWRT